MTTVAWSGPDPKGLAVRRHVSQRTFGGVLAITALTLGAVACSSDADDPVDDDPIEIPGDDAPLEEPVETEPVETAPVDE